MVAIANSATEEDYNGYEPEEGIEGQQDERSKARILNFEKEALKRGYGPATKKVKEEEFKKAKLLAQQKARQLILRWIAWGFGATLVGLVVTWAILAGQFILSEWLKVEGVPALELWEKIVLGVLSLLILLVFIIFLALVIIVLRMALNPAEFLIHFGRELFSWFGEIIGL